MKNSESFVPVYQLLDCADGQEDILGLLEGYVHADWLFISPFF